MVNLIDLKREINHILGEKSTDYFKLLTLYFSGRIEKGKDSYHQVFKGKKLFIRIMIQIK